MPASDREQALQEADLLARLAHPCIVRYSSSFVEHGALHIVSIARACAAFTGQHGRSL